jgi:hypothetical protein
MFLSEPCPNEGASALYARDLAEDGYVGNLTRLWAWRPDVFNAFLSLRTLLTGQGCTVPSRACTSCVCHGRLPW